MATVELKKLQNHTDFKDFKAVLDPLADIVHNSKTHNELIVLAVGGAISDVVMKGVEGLTNVFFDWLKSSMALKPLTNALRFRFLGGVVDVPRIVGILFYIIISFIILTLVVYGVLSPLLSDVRKKEDKTR